MPETSQPVRGWVFYDGECGFCSRWLSFWQPTLNRHGYAIAPLQEPWVVAQFHLPAQKLLSDLRLLTPDGRSVAGADVYLHVARTIWWAWPFYAVFSLPGFNRLIHRTAGSRVIVIASHTPANCRKARQAACFLNSLDSPMPGFCCSALWSHWFLPPVDGAT
jgi:predicted DCC family thiol-disulfide oxidoreductase YuxK